MGAKYKFIRKITINEGEIMGILGKYYGKPDLDNIRLLTINGLLPIVEKWLESFDSVYSEDFEQFITSDTIIGHFVGFVQGVCGRMGLKDYKAFTGVLYFALGGAFSKHFKNVDELRGLIDKPLRNFLNNNTEEGVLDGQFTATFYLKRVENPGPQYYQTSGGKMRNHQTYFFMIENAAKDFLN